MACSAETSVLVTDCLLAALGWLNTLAARSIAATRGVRSYAAPESERQSGDRRGETTS